MVNSMSNIGTKYILASRFTFDPNTNSLIDVEYANEIIRLGSNESRILLLLAEKPNEVISRNELHDFVWREQGFEVDDSSLTQAISTLRKLLKDSTKSPQFVKTVPKRGYQLICSVERTTPLLSGDEETSALDLEPDMDLESPQERLPEVESAPELITVEEALPEPDLKNKSVGSSPTQKESKPLSWSVRIMLGLALLLPLFVVLLTSPAESEFRQIGTYDNVSVKTTVNHPDLSRWNASIEQCIIRYNKTHTGELTPIEVIATGGQNNQLVLNYIHSLKHSGENVTLRIFAEQEDFSKVCQ